MGADATNQDSAWVTYDGDSAIILTWIPPSGPWSALFAGSYFGAPGPGSVVGQPFLFTSIDELGIEHQTGPAYVWRVIEDVDTLYYPPLPPPGTSPDTICWNPTFVWWAFSADYPFAYQVNVVNQTSGFETTVWTSPLLVDTLVQYPDSLPNGDYYWTVTVLDSFDNSSRSKEAPFVVDTSAHDTCQHFSASLFNTFVPVEKVLVSR